MECGFCMFDRLKGEGMWDRFGTTLAQEIEAMCDEHLLEQEHRDSFVWTKDESKLLTIERERRGLKSRDF